MKKLLCILGLMLLTIIAIVGCGAGTEQAKEAEPVELMVSVAASLTDAMQEIKEIYAEQHPEVNITYNFAASGTLQRQIEEGAPVDLFISAGKSQMDALEEKGLIVGASRKDLLGNEIVLIAAENCNLTGFEGLADDDIGKISIGTPETVPAGKYAQETLMTLGLWDELQPKLVPAKDVRQVLHYVETGNVDGGMVYRSDALLGRGIKVVAAAPADSHRPIVYPMAIIKSTKHPEAVEAFAAFLSGDEAAQIFTKYGFITLGSG